MFRNNNKTQCDMTDHKTQCSEKWKKEEEERTNYAQQLKGKANGMSKWN